MIYMPKVTYLSEGLKETVRIPEGAIAVTVDYICNIGQYKVMWLEPVQQE
jgi:hypothetical protein